MPPPPHSRPENVLKRAQELIGVEQQQAALSLLHEHVISKRTRNSPIASLEPVMLLFVELCVDLRRGKLAKDGLYQYKNTAQNTNVATIELVFKKFIELAELKVTEAQAKADQVQSSLESTNSTANVDDLEASETPESILLSTVSGEQSRDRTDRAIVTPWLKFLWETYRTVLDIFKNNARLEVMYQSTAHQAFQFCSKYARKTEFRRLCELLRNHLQNAAKFSAQMHAINLSDPDTLQRHLDTRFQQLNVAVELELWQEAFRSVEDIHTLLSLSKRPAKNIMMANYFEKLTRIFLVSENYLFHAAAWSRYYNLMRQSAAAVASGQSAKKDNPAVTEADMTKAASFVLLSALAIPVISTSRSRGALVDVDEAKKNKNVRLTNLLGMSLAPTRVILFKDALSKGLLKRCRPEIRDLYNILEVDFHPLSICKKISPILTQIGADPEMERYVLPLQQVILTRLFQQLSQVYESVDLKFVLDLAQFPDPFQVTGSTIEKFIMNGCKKGDLAIRIDHSTGSLTFDSDVFSAAKALHPGSGAGSAEAENSSVQRLQSTPAEIVRSQLTRLAKSLYITCQYVDPEFNRERHAAMEAALARAKAGAEQEHVDTLARRQVIEQKKQAASDASARRERDMATEKRVRAQQQQAAEAKRLADEQKARDMRRLEAERARVQEEEAQKALEELKRGTKGINLDEINVAELDTGAIRRIKIEALEKEKSKLSDHLRSTARRTDHLERAYRKEEVKHLDDDYKDQTKRDKAAHEKAETEKQKEAQKKHTEDVALKHRLGRLLSTYELFKDEISTQRHAEFDRKKKAAERELKQKMEQRRTEIRERRAKEKRQKEEEERMAREEEEARIKEEEQRAVEAEEKRAKEERAREEALKRRQEADLVAAKQAQREAEAEARAAERKSATKVGGPSGGDLRRIPDRSVAAADGARAESSGPAAEERGPPRIQLAGSKPSWREREAARQVDGAAGGSAPTPAADAAVAAEGEPPKRGGYLPPALRAEGGRAGGWRERENSGRGRDADRSDTPPAAAGSRWQAPQRRGEASADAPAAGGKFMPPHMRGRVGDRERDASPAGSVDSSGLPMERSGSQGGSGRGGGRYVPPSMRNRQ